MKNQITTDIARSYDDLVLCSAIRAVVYVGEQGWNFTEEWDGNDFTATHILARVDGEAAGSVRIRYFADFFKPERLAVLPQFRNKRYGGRGVAWELTAAAFEFCRKKGFTRVYGHALEERVGFWAKASGGVARPMSDQTFDCNGKPVIPMCGDFEPHPDAVSLDSGHMVLVRPEGRWDRPGFWELPHLAAEKNPAEAA